MNPPQNTHKKQKREQQQRTVLGLQHASNGVGPCDVRRGLVVVVEQVGVGAKLHETLAGGGTAVGGGQHQWRVALERGDAVEVRPNVGEVAHDPGPSADRCHVERLQAFAVHRGGVGAQRHQLYHHREVALVPVVN